MTREPFVSRVRALRESWDERRKVVRLAATHTFDSQFLLLLTLHEWACEAVADVRDVYGIQFAIDVGPAPERNQDPPSFSVVVAEVHALTLSITERRRGIEPSWHVTVSVEGELQAHAAGPDRRNGHWTRSRLEDVLLSVLGAYERSIGA